MLRITKILLIASVALWALIGAIANIIDWEGTNGAVAATVSMSTFELTGSSGWQATTNPAVIIAGAVFIVGLKLLTAGLCFTGAGRMWSARKGEVATFDAAKTLALAGCGVAVFMLFAGWIVIAETWFELWRSDALRDVALNSAFRYCGMIGLIALFVAQRND